eukprot:5437273-Pleurochrysis_carterae.AAC.1
MTSRPGYQTSRARLKPPSADPSRLPTRAPDSPAAALSSKTVLLLFAGPFRHPDGIAAFLKQA